MKTTEPSAPSKTSCVVFAGGTGNRFGGQKQFEMLGTERAVDRVVRTALATCDHVVLVLPVGHEWTGAEVDVVVEGGNSHAESVRNGVDHVPAEAAIILLAAASHPLASAALFDATIEAVRAGADAAVPRRNMADAIKRHVDGRIIETVQKHDLAFAQSPSTFAAPLFRKCLAERREVPEELQLVEEAGGLVVFVPGEETNVHITTPLELEMARRFLDLVDDPGPKDSGAEPVT